MRHLSCALTCAMLAMTACSESSVAEKLPDIRLPTLSARSGASLASCPTPKCLTAYQAPWCGYCRRSTPMLLALNGFLQERGVTMRFVVGKDRLSSLRAYAQELGPDTLLDMDDSFPVSGVPHFFVSDQSGRILKEVSGVPTGDISLEELAASFGLP